MAGGSTVIVYNGVTLFNTQMRGFRQESILDDSGTDLLYHRFTIRAVGYFVNMSNYPSRPLAVGIGASGRGQPFGPNPGPLGNYNSGSANQVFSQSAAMNMVEVRHRLGEQRKSFSMSFGCNADASGGQLVLQAFPGDFSGRNVADPIDPASLINVDLSNGPKAKVIDVVHVSADEVLKCEVEFEICVLECVKSLDGASADQSPTAPAVLSNRWNVTDAIDRNFFTTRTYGGRLRLASVNINPQDFRSWIVPPVFPGFRRDQMQFTVSMDGLMIDYTIVDKEVAYSPPAPATTWRFQHTESTGQGGTHIFGDLAVTLGGDRNVPRTLLVAMIAVIIDNVLLTRDPNNPSQALGEQFYEELSFTDDVSDDACLVHGHARIRRAPMQPAQAGGPKDFVSTFKFVCNQTLCISLDKLPNFQNELNNIDVSGIPQYGNSATYGEQFFDYDPNRSRDCYDPDLTQDHPELFGPLDSSTAFACYLQDPCNCIHNIGSLFNPYTPNQSEGPGDSSGGSVLEIRITPQLPDDPDSGNPDDPNQLKRESLYGFYGGPQSGPYTHWRQESHIKRSTGRIQLPIATPPGQSTQSPQPQQPDPGAPQYDPNAPLLPPASPTPWYPWDPAGQVPNMPGFGAPPPATSYAPSPNSAIISMCPDTYQRIVRVEGERVGEQVLLPVPIDLLDPSGNGVSQLLLDFRVVSQTVDYTSDRRPIFRAAAEYVYALDRPPSLAGFPVGVTPWTVVPYQYTGPLFVQPDQLAGDQATSNPA